MSGLQNDLGQIRTRLNQFSGEIAHALSRDLPVSKDEEEDDLVHNLTGGDIGNQA